MKSHIDVMKNDYISLLASIKTSFFSSYIPTSLISIQYMRFLFLMNIIKVRMYFIALDGYEKSYLCDEG